MNKWETLQHSHCSNFRELQQSIAREPSAPNFNVPAYQSTPAAPAAGPTPAPRTVFVSSHSQSQTSNTSAAHVRPMIIYHILIYVISPSTCRLHLPSSSSSPRQSPSRQQGLLHQASPLRQHPPLPLAHHPLALPLATLHLWFHHPRPRDHLTPAIRAIQGELLL